MKKVRAKERGFDNVKVREAGEEFMHEGEMFPWMEEAEGAPKEEAQRMGDEVNKQQEEDVHLDDVALHDVTHGEGVNEDVEGSASVPPRPPIQKKQKKFK